MLPEKIRRGLAANGVDRLWSHQTEGIAAIRRQQDLLVTTPTASGKSLIFHLPVLEAIHDGQAGRALFLYPLKALAQDQKGKFDALAQISDLGAEASCAIYDGDTPRGQRQRIKQDLPRVLITNPDMLHLGILSYWEQWQDLLSDLRWLVIDELHTYRGIFGSHFHHVVQRLLRVCRELGSDPVIVASSATAGNADQFAHQLTGRDFQWIAESGAPREGRHFLLLRPDSSPYTASLQLFVNLLQSGLKTIVFTKARRITELLFSWLSRAEPEISRRVASYRSGFLPEERREIEAKLFDGRLDGVISTSALEMGIDVGGLDACILVGYPGSVMATWQRSGRVGRSGKESITALVALPDALDQYLLDHPEELLSRPLEKLIVDPLNEPVSRGHLVCAAAELPLRRDRDAQFLEPRAAMVGDLLASHQLIESADGSEIFTRRRRPQRLVNLRGVESTTGVLDSQSGRVIGTVDGVRAQRECHPGAVYLHAGKQYLVRELDLEEGKAHAEAARLDYFTVPLTEKETEVLEILDQRREGPLQFWLGRLLVTERVVGFERKRIQSREAFDRHKLELPPMTFETVGLWWSCPRSLEETIRNRGLHFMGALHASEHAAISLMPLLVVCDRGDIGGISIPFHPQVKTGGVFIYDGHPGGVGISRRAFETLPDLLDRVIQLLDECECDEGCPSCVQSPKCGNGNRPLDKSAAILLLRSLRGHPEGVAGFDHPDVELELLSNVSVPDDLSVGSELTVSEWAPPQFEAETTARPIPISEPDPFPENRQQEDPEAEVIQREIVPSGGTVLFDLETQRSAADVGGWQNAHRMLVAVGVACHLEEGLLETYHEEDIHRLLERLEGADLVVGFNVNRFDYRVLSGYTGVDYAKKLPTLDLLQEIHGRLGFRLSLNHLALETLGVEKSADGLQSLEWFKQGRMDLIESYCRKDVEILRDLYLFGRRMGHVFYRDRQQRKLKLPVDW
jgi:DEAD/DEAH box helicase domain-containing protein